MEGGVDFISSLPEEILRKIVSLIPCKEALKTAVLSDSWKNLWSPFQLDLGFDSSKKLSDESKERLNKIFSEFLKSFDYPEKLKINFQSGNYAQSNDEFLAVVTKGTQNDLYFDFSGYEDPNSRFNFVLDPMCNPLNSNCPGFSSLKSIHFRLIPAVAANVVSDLFTNFEFLECLTFEKCRELKNIDIRSNESLLSLTILDCCNIDNIKFSAPKLRIFSYRGHLPYIEMIKAPELIDVTLDLKDGLGNKAFDCEDVLCLLSCFKDVEKLTINGWLLEWLCCAGVIFKQLEFKFTKLKELWCVNSSMDKSKRDSIACFLDSTPIIEKLFVKNDPKCMDIEISSTPYFHTCWHDHHIGRDCVTVKRNGSPLKYLKQIELLNFTCNEKDEVLFMDLLLHRAVNLKNMMMISPDMDTWKVNVVPSSQVHNQVRGQTRYMVVPTPFGGYSSYLFTDAAKRIW